MAGWYNSGVWEGLPVQDLKEILSDLCCAVNEREEAVGRGLADGEGLTEWELASTTKTYPTASDFDSLPLRHGGTDPNVGNIVDSLQSAINSLVYYCHAGANSWKCKFTNSARTDIYWNAGDVLALGSYGSSWITLAAGSRLQYTPIYLQIKEVLEKLRYIVVYPIVTSQEATSMGYFLGEHETYTFEEAYDNAVATLPDETYHPIFPGLPYGLGIEGDEQYYTDPAVMIVAVRTYTWGTNGLVGNVLSSTLNVQKYGYSIDTSLDVNLTQPTVTISSGTYGFPPVYTNEDVSVSGWPIGSGTTTTCSLDLPSDEPFGSDGAIYHDDGFFVLGLRFMAYSTGISGVDDPYSRAIIDLNGEFTYTA